MALTLGLNKCDNATYHADKTHLSSSVIKTLYKSLELYHKEYILGLKPEFKNKSALEEGSLAHSLLLEPELTEQEFTYWDGWTKRGAEWDAFIADSQPGKTIISAPQKNRVDRLVAACKALPEAIELLQGGEAEQTICNTLKDIDIKVRFDYINVEKGYIADVKTTGYSSDLDSFRVQAEGLMYDLSAALYCKIAEIHYGKKFDFYFIVLSKKDFTCDVYKCSQAFMVEGMRKINIGLEKYKKALASGLWVEKTMETSNEDAQYAIQEI